MRRRFKRMCHEYAKLSRWPPIRSRATIPVARPNASDLSIAQTQTLLSVPGVQDVQTFSASGTWTNRP